MTLRGLSRFSLPAIFTAAAPLITTPMALATPLTSVAEVAGNEKSSVANESVLVIGNKIDEQRNDLAGSLDLIGRDELDYVHIDDTVELFDKAPGVNIARYNQGIVNADIAIRGFAGDGTTPHAKLLIDGIPANLHAGGPELDQIFPVDISTIQLFKGTSDPRYGIFNIAGNYNVITRSDVGNNKIEFTTGSYDAREIQGYAGFENGGLTHNYAFGYRESHGYRDHTDLSKYSVSGRWFYDFENQATLGLIARMAGYEGDAPGFLDKQTARSHPEMSAAYANQDGGEKTTRHISLHSELPLSDSVSIDAKFYWQNFERERWVRFSAASAIQDRYDDQDHQGVITNLNWQIDSQWQFTAGINSEQQDVVEQRFGTVGQTRQRDTRNVLRNYHYELDTLGGFAQIQHTPNDVLRWNVSYRIDKLRGDSTQIGATGTRIDSDIFDFGIIKQPKFNIFLSPISEVTLFANYGRSFQHPVGAALFTVSDTHARDVSMNDGWEVGASWRPLDTLTTRLSRWEQNASDEYVTVDGTPQNVGKTRRQGIDAGFSLQLFDTVDVWGNYGVANTKIVRASSTDNATVGNELRSIPDYTASLGVSYAITPAFITKLHIDAQGDYYINEANLGGRYGSYTLVGANLTHTAMWGDISLQINNIFDRYYEYVYDFGNTGADAVFSPGDGRNFSLSVSWKL